MSTKKVSYCNKVINRVKEVSSSNNLDEVANFLGIKPSTLRSRKSRGSVPFEEIVAKVNRDDLSYVLKGAKIYKERHGKSHKEVNDKGVKYAEDVIENQLEAFATSIIKRIENAPFSQSAKLRIVDSLIRIVEQDLAANRQENEHSGSGHGPSVDDQS